MQSKETLTVSFIIDLPSDVLSECASKHDHDSGGQGEHQDSHRKKSPGPLGPRKANRNAGSDPQQAWEESAGDIAYRCYRSWEGKGWG
ncbi:unnamed protein product [Tilletia laevis]|uniref:Uncharacterized protein n=2 Tax=Tilletia TaxID=13289 RepID=A0A9N8LRK0_9BASI|nr:hypothetical protein CF336_g4510 [Tilletia laevis]KAE8261732.1 hypothetical protein A4X03_0g3010 [Tilletia caries]CAD6978965.1 unnamed protein product [Tilletia controversa]KAE8207324.1 hypothetical protein CF335_g1224 [Tilletia laevis]CAD6899739.1 unnamed protein product [Tilletia caries]